MLLKRKIPPSHKTLYYYEKYEHILTTLVCFDFLEKKNIQLIQIPHDKYHDISYSFAGQSVTVGVSLYVLCLTSMSEVDMVIMKLSQRNFVFLGLGHKINHQII